MLYSYFDCFLTLPRMREMSATEERYKAVLALIAEITISIDNRRWICYRAPIDDHRLKERPPMPGASEHARKVKILNANWVAGTDGGDGQFEVMIVTDDDRTDTVPVSPASITALIALTQAGTVLVWDPADRTLIAANVVGTMPWTESQ
jgi:hypothetical protein